MEYNSNNQSNLLKIIMNIVFYILLVLLIGFIIFPYTSFYYKERFINPFSMKLNVSSVVLEEGEYFRLHVNRINKRVKYSSTDFKVAYVSINGKIHAKHKGSAIIKAKVDGKVLKCKVKVIKKKK